MSDNEPVSNIEHIPQIEESERIHIAECNLIPKVLNARVREVAREVKKAQLRATCDKQKRRRIEHKPRTFIEYADWLIGKAKM